MDLNIIFAPLLGFGVAAILEFVWPSQIAYLFGTLNSVARADVEKARGDKLSTKFRVVRMLFAASIFSAFLYGTGKGNIWCMFCSMIGFLGYGSYIGAVEIWKTYAGLRHAMRSR